MLIILFRPVILRFTLFAMLCGSFVACQDIDVAHDLNQKQANEIIAILSEQGIAAHASRGTGSRAQFIVEVPSNRYSEAISILHYEDLPKLEEPSVADLLAPKGFLPNSRELETMRIDRAIATELENMLKTNPAVNEVTAVVRRPVLEGVGPQPAAHVSLMNRKNHSFQIDKETIIALVAKMIPGVSADTVVIDIQEALPVVGGARKGVFRSGSDGKVVSIPMKEFLGWWRVAENDYDRMVLVLLCSVLGFLIVGLFVGFSAGFIGRKVVSSKSIDNLAALKNERATLSLNSPE